MHEFQIGDRIKVKEDYLDSDVAGRYGVVAQAPAGVSLHEKCLWIELDVDRWEPGIVDGAEVDSEHLEDA